MVRLSPRVVEQMTGAFSVSIARRDFAQLPPGALAIATPAVAFLAWLRSSCSC
jgi:hypothetical protein